MRIIPVLDLQSGHVVRGIAGRRAEYQAIKSRLTPSSLPVEVATAIRDEFGCMEFYLADLDAIAGNPPALGIYRTLIERGFTLWADAGIRTAAEAVPLAAAGVAVLVAGLETLTGPAALAELVQRWGVKRVVFSLDLKGGKPLAASQAWNTDDPYDVACQAVQGGVRQLLVLDLARVGTGRGVGTGLLCSRIRSQFPQVACMAGGGVQSAAELRELAEAGLAAVLVASALHDGRLTPADVASLTRPV